MMRPYTLTSSSAKADDPVFRDARIFCEGSDYWIPVFAGMTGPANYKRSESMARLVGETQHERHQSEGNGTDHRRLRKRRRDRRRPAGQTRLPAVAQNNPP